MRVLLLMVLCLPFGYGQNGHKLVYSGDNFKIEQLTDDVYACIHLFGGKAICNAGVVNLGDETLIFDSFLSPEVAEELLEVINNLGLPEVNYVVNSHGHNDHIRGNQVFRDEVQIISTKKVREKILNEEKVNIASEKIFGPEQYTFFQEQMVQNQSDTISRAYLVAKMMAPYFQVLSQSYNNIKVTPPNSVFEGERRIIGRDREVVLMEFDSCHTASDVILFLPEEKILFAGDLIFNEFHPYLAEGKPDQWEQALARIDKLEPLIIVPGHGEISDNIVIIAMRSYLKVVRSIVETEISSNTSLEDLDFEIPQAFKDWWLDHFFRENVIFLYRTLTANK